VCRRTSGDGWHIDPCAASREEYGCVAWREAEESVLGEASHMSVTSHTSTGILGDASHMLVTSHTSTGILGDASHMSVTRHTSTGILGDASHMLVTSHTSAGILKSMACTSGGMSSYVWATDHDCAALDLTCPVLQWHIVAACSRAQHVTAVHAQCTCMWMGGWHILGCAPATRAAAVSTRASEAKAQA